MMMTSRRKHVKDVATDLLLEFLEAALHEYLFAWKVYPAEAFARRVLYDAPVHMCRHPQLCEYIHSMLRGCREWIVNGALEKMAVPILAKNGRIVDTLVLETHWIADVVTAIDNGDQELSIRVLEEEFRAALIAISTTPYARGGTRPSDDVNSFRILAHTIEDAALPSSKVDANDVVNSWVLADPYWYDEARADEETKEESNGKELFPVRSIASSELPLQLQVYLEKQR